MLIYCINLKHRTDRKIHSLNEFKKLGVSEDKIIYLPFVKDTRGGVYGCFDSHMKIWTDFLSRFPNEKYAFVFEDDFVYSDKDITILKRAKKFIKKNDKEVDILYLHPYCVNLEHEKNNDLFTHGYGLGTHVYVITRRYIESIIEKYGSLPLPNGRHLDYEKNINVLDKENRLYSSKMFYTKKVCFTQRIDKSDNYINTLDKLFRVDINKTLDFPFFIIRYLKKRKLITDVNAKILFCYLQRILIEK
jgi:hypothetical protein